MKNLFKIFFMPLPHYLPTLTDYIKCDLYLLSELLLPTTHSLEHLCERVTNSFKDFMIMVLESHL